MKLLLKHQIQQQLLQLTDKHLHIIGVCGDRGPGHHIRTDVLMIDALVRRFLGTAGTGLLDFYVQHSLWINALLFTYALLVVFARRNYGQVAQHILAEFLQKHGDKLARKSPKEIRALLLKWKIPWEKGMQAGWFPFIASPQGILLRLKSDRTFQEIFPIEVLVETIVRQTSSRS